MKIIYSAGVFSLSLLLTSSALADSVCQCVPYVRNRLVNTLGVASAVTQTGPAKDWGEKLVSIGLHWSGVPRNGPAQAGDIAVFQINYGHGFDTVNGHIAFVESASFNADTQMWRLTIFGANQGGNLRADNGCSNVSTITTNYKEFSGTDERTVSYYYLH